MERIEIYLIGSLVGILTIVFLFSQAIMFDEWDPPEWKCYNYLNATYETSAEFDMCYAWCGNTQNATEQECYDYCNEDFPVKIEGECIEQFYSRSLRNEPGK